MICRMVSVVCEHPRPAERNSECKAPCHFTEPGLHYARGGQGWFCVRRQVNFTGQDPVSVDMTNGCYLYDGITNTTSKKCEKSNYVCNTSQHYARHTTISDRNESKSNDSSRCNARLVQRELVPLCIAHMLCLLCFLRPRLCLLQRRARRR